jgi:hypothetical protein
LVGYGGPYVESLTKESGGGLRAHADDWSQLADYTQGLHLNRAKLCSLVRGAARGGRSFDRNAAMRRKIALIKRIVATPFSFATR